MSGYDVSLQLTSPTHRFSAKERIGMVLVGLGVLTLLAAFFGASERQPLAFLLVSFGLLGAGAWIYFQRFADRPEGIDNDGLMFSSFTARGALGWILGVVLTGGYILLYWWPETLAGLIVLADP